MAEEKKQSAQQQNDVFYSLKHMLFVDRDKVKPNGYNPNHVLKQNMELLKQSILSNGFCFPIVIRPDYTIIDGFHRWLISGTEPIRTLMGGMIPVVIVNHKDKIDDVAGTIAFNRARGEHLLDPMENIVQGLLKEGYQTKEIAKKLGMSQEELYRLSNVSREDFLKLMSKENRYNQARKI